MSNYIIYIGNKEIVTVSGSEACYTCYEAAMTIAEMTCQTASLVCGETGEVVAFYTTEEEEYEEEEGYEKPAGIDNKNIPFDALREAMLCHRIVEWKDNYIRLDNGMELCIEETAQDCCAEAYGQFEDVVLDAAITHVSDIQYDRWEDGDTYGCSAVVTIMHNRNVICKAVGNADAGNGGYYYSIASFCVKMPNGQDRQCFFVGSDNQ